jgi:hypothetical protein
MDYDAAVAIIVVMVPAAMPATVVSIEPGARTTVVIAAITTIAADAETEFGRARNRWRGYSHRSDGSEYKLPHVPLQSLLRTRGKQMPRPTVSGTPQELS